MSDPARIEAALRTLHGMLDMGCRKANGRSLEDTVEHLSRQPLIHDDFAFSVMCAVVCMKETLDGDAPAHARHCTIFQHDRFDPANCTCNRKDAA